MLRSSQSLFTFLFIILLIYSHAFRNYTCFHTFPNSGGKWESFPPYFTPDCAAEHFRTFDVTNCEECLQGRTVYALGSSIARQALFGVLEMLGGDIVSRKEQKERCPSTASLQWEDSCQQSFANVNFRYLYLQWMDQFNYTGEFCEISPIIPLSHGNVVDGFPFLKGNTTFIKNQSSLTSLSSSSSSLSILPMSIKGIVKETLPFPDNCFHKKVFLCLKAFFSKAKENDILLLNVGLSYAVNRHESIDSVKWANTHATAFRAQIDTLFPGTVFWITNSYLGFRMASFSETVRAVDQLALAPVFTQHARKVHSWYVIDQWQINQDRFGFYADHVHYPGPLTHATLHQVFNILCPSKGLSQDLYRQLSRKIIIYQKEGNSNNQTFYLLDDRFRLRQVHSDCFPFLKTQQRIQVNESVYRGLILTYDFPSHICTNGSVFIYRHRMYLMQTDGRIPISPRNLTTEITFIDEMAFFALKESKNSSSFYRHHQHLQLPHLWFQNYTKAANSLAEDKNVSSALSVPVAKSTRVRHSREVRKELRQQSDFKADEDRSVHLNQILRTFIPPPSAFTEERRGEKQD